MTFWRSKTGNRILAALAAGMLVSGSLSGFCGKEEWKNTGFVESEQVLPGFRAPYVGAWWGWLYPDFCFQNREKDPAENEVHFGFWVAKVLDWW